MGTYEKRFWDSTNYGRPSGPYSPYTPDELSGWEFEFSGETAGAIARTTEALVRFQEQGVFGQVKVSEMVKGAFRFGKRKFSEMVRPTGRAPTPAPPTVRTSYR